MLGAVILTLISLPAFALIEENQAFNDFIGTMVSEHQFDETELRHLFQAVEIKDKILQAISAPAEALPWYKYRKIFLTDSRIKDGLRFWRENEPVLTTVEKEYGVPPEIITAIIGVETRYGAHTGSYRVIDALATLAFAYPKRSQFFSSELVQFLILCRDEQLDPLEPLGSYAGAMGVPQFMPSSYIRYAADFDLDSKRDIWHNNADVIASVANYFAQHRWQKGAAIAFPVTASGDAYRQALTKGLQPDTSVAQLKHWQVSVPEQLNQAEKVKLLAFEQENDEELWLGLHNFYVITRYNHSPLYAMAVYQLSQAIAEQKKMSNEE
ncbi:lytic murein transglycosylase B [Methylomarinum vadi]|uniref:lytic murein transglycosylase B n=1 Tax=Methylomarinum vadi TaxID=438855 RepID=UPI001F318262|nr:lytic murein transglycosylase B [Methylomarinum vadi]